MFMAKVICHTCNNEFEAKSRKAAYCSHTCKMIDRSRKTFPDGTDFVECKECGIRAKQLLQHIEKVHKMSIDDYCEKHNCTRYDLSCKSLHDQMSTNILKACKEGKCGWQKGGKNPSHDKETKLGRKSKWSKNYKGYDGLSIEEKEEAISKFANEVAKIRDINGNTTTKLEYYLNRGMSTEEAKQALKARQTTFSKEQCIKKYGEKQGLEIFNKRQEKWQNTLNSKPIEEIQRINKAKMLNGKGYSNISQQLFKVLHNELKTVYSQIYYATSNNENTFSEYMVHDNISGHNYFLDFYVKDNNKVIEFDGDYWHGEKRGNKERDRKREEALNKLGYINIFHVKERDYKRDPNRVIQECLEFIRN